MTVGENTFPIASGDEQVVCVGRTQCDSVTIDVTRCGGAEALARDGVQGCIVEEAGNGALIGDELRVSVE